MSLRPIRGMNGIASARSNPALRAMDAYDSG